MTPAPSFTGRRPSRWLGVFLALALGSSARAEVLTLEDCLREAASNNAAIIAARLDVQRATGTRLVLRARALPTFNVGGTVGYEGAQDAQTLQQRVPQPGGGAATTRTSTPRAAQFILIGTENLEQPIFDAAIPASWRRGDVGVLAVQQNYYTLAVAELYQTRALFYQTLRQQERGALLRQAQEVLASNVRTVEGLVSAGLKARPDLLSAQVRSANFAPSVTDAAGSYRSSLALLLQRMGRRPGPGPGGTDALDAIRLRGRLDEVAMRFDAEAVGRAALAQRPDIQALRAAVRSAREDANIVRGGYFPKIRLYVAGELLPQSFVRSNRPNAIRASDQVQTTEIRPGVREDWNIVDTGTVRGEARRVDAGRAETEVLLQRLERNVPGELAGVCAILEQGAATLAALGGNVEVAQNTLNIINAGVAQGINSQFEFLDAQSGVLNTQLGIVDAKFALSAARNEFDRITGRFLRYVTDDVPTGADGSNRQ